MKHDKTEYRNFIVVKSTDMIRVSHKRSNHLSSMRSYRAYRSVKKNLLEWGTKLMQRLHNTIKNGSIDMLRL